MKKTILIFLSILISAFSVYAGTFESLLDEGDKLYLTGKYKEAEPFFTKAIAAAPDNAKGYWYRGDTFFHMKKYSEAEKDYTRSIEIDPSNPKVFKQRGSCFYNRDMFIKAADDYSKAIELNPADGQSWLYRGDCYRKLKENDKALDDYRKADSLGNRNAKKYINMLTSAAHKEAFASLNNIKVEPFTGAVLKSSGLTYDNMEIVPKKDNAYITGNDIPLKYPFAININKPRNFKKDNAGNVFVGAGFGVYDRNGKELAMVEDIFKNSDQGLPSEFLTSLSMTITLTGPIVAGADCVLKIWFIDKKGNGRIDIRMPFRVTEKASISKSILSTDSILGYGIFTKAVNASAESVSIAENDMQISFNALSPEKSYLLKISGFKNCKAESYNIEFIGDDGLSVKGQSGKLEPEENIKLPLSTEGLDKKNYYLRVRIDGNNKSCYTMVIPVSVK